MEALVAPARSEQASGAPLQALFCQRIRWGEGGGQVASASQELFSATEGKPKQGGTGAGWESAGVMGVRAREGERDVFSLTWGLEQTLETGEFHIRDPPMTYTPYLRPL